MTSPEDQDTIDFLTNANAGLMAQLAAEEAKVKKMKDEIRNGSFNWFRDNPGMAAIIVFVCVLALMILMLVLRNVHFTAQAWVCLMAIGAPALGLATFVVLEHWKKQHELDHPTKTT